MANSKVQLADGSVLIDLTSDTVTAAALRSGYTAHDASGNIITGTMDASEESGRPTACDNDVILIDFDGEVLYSYSAEEFASLAELPTIPVLKYDFLQQDGWNWTLSDAKSYVAKYTELVIGAQYTTKDGASHILASAQKTQHNFWFSIKFTGGTGQSVSIDWGDSSEPTTETGIGNNVTKLYSHTYTESGLYDISISPSTPKSQITNVFRACAEAVAFVGTAQTEIFPWGNYDIIFTSGCTGTRGSMAKQHYGKAYVFPRGFLSTYGNSNWFSNVQPQGVRYISWPNGFVGAFWNWNYSGCTMLRKLTAPEASVQGNNGTFKGCVSLRRLNIPENVTSLGSEFMSGCTALAEVHFYPTTPPTVANANAFTNLPTSCIIYVPSGSLEAYTTATNYPSAESYTYVEE